MLKIGEVRELHSALDRHDGSFYTAAGAEACTPIDGLPLVAENLMDHEFIPIGPLMHRGALFGGAPQQK